MYIPRNQDSLPSMYDPGTVFLLMLQELGKDAAVLLTNSLFIADKPRISQAQRLNRTKLFTDMCPFRHGKTFCLTQILIGYHMCSNHRYISQIPLLFKIQFGFHEQVRGLGYLTFCIEN